MSSFVAAGTVSPFAALFFLGTLFLLVLGRWARFGFTQGMELTFRCCLPILAEAKPTRSGDAFQFVSARGTGEFKVVHLEMVEQMIAVTIIAASANAVHLMSLLSMPAITANSVIIIRA